MKSSLHAAFTVIWLFIVASCIATGFLMLGLYRLGVDARVDTVAARVDKAEAALRTRFAVYAQSYPTAPDFTDLQRRRELALILQIVLQDYEDVEGGFYAPSAGFVAYAFPSYEGSGTKQDVPEAEAARIAALAERVATSGRADVQRTAGARQTLILAAAPVAAGDQRLAVWVMSRAHVRADSGATRLELGIGLLGFFVVASGLALLYTIRRWNDALARLGRDLSDVARDDAWEPTPTGHRDLDRVATMVAALHCRLAEQNDAARRMQTELARAQRVATVGRMSAQLVHEIRNPLAAMRLHAENARAGATDRDVALARILDDVRRLDDLLGRMQAMTRLNALDRRPVALDAWLAETLAPLAARAADAGVELSSSSVPIDWPIDPAQLSRAVGNLVVNAIQHVPTPGGHVAVRIDADPHERCRIIVEDDGPGIADDALERIFEPFHTTRAEGSGLGLSIAREIVEAHGGTLEARRRDDRPGAVFVIALPWPES